MHAESMNRVARRKTRPALVVVPPCVKCYGSAPMGEELPFRCRCGAVRAVAQDVTPETVNRVVCSCKFCRSYARILRGASELTDDWEGTSMFHMSPRHLSFGAGFDQVSCLRLTETGAIRWYTVCCRTPVANTFPHGRVPFMAMMEIFIDRTLVTRPVDQVLGPVRARVNTALSGEEAKRQSARWTDLVGMLFRLLPKLFRWWRRGDHKHFPFFDAETATPVIEPVRVHYRKPVLPAGP